LGPLNGKNLSLFLSPAAIFSVVTSSPSWSFFSVSGAALEWTAPYFPLSEALFQVTLRDLNLFLLGWSPSHLPFPPPDGFLFPRRTLSVFDAFFLLASR